MKVPVPQDIIDGYAQHGISVRRVQPRKDKWAVSYFVIKAEGWSEKIETLAGLYNFLAGINRGTKI